MSTSQFGEQADIEEVAIPQSDLYEEFGEQLKKRGYNLAKWRAEFIPSDQWWKDGVKIFWTAEAVVRLRIWIEEPHLTSKIFRVKVVRWARNPRWAMCEHNRAMIAVAMPKKLHGKNLRGRMIEIEEIQDATGRSYRHASLAR